MVAKRFQSIHPGMHLIVREGTTSELAEGMEHGEYDLALTLLPIDRRLFYYEKVVEEELVLAVPASSPSFSASTVSGLRYPAVDASVLEGQRFVVLTDPQFMQRQLKNLCIDHHLTIFPAAIVKSLEAQIEMVKSGLGMAPVPSGIERFCKPNEVTFYSFASSLPRREAVVMWRRERQLSRAARD